jgi:hypothetical protein
MFGVFSSQACHSFRTNMLPMGQRGNAEFEAIKIAEDESIGVPLHEPACENANPAGNLLSQFRRTGLRP